MGDVVGHRYSFLEARSTGEQDRRRPAPVLAAGGRAGAEEVAARIDERELAHPVVRVQRRLEATPGALVARDADLFPLGVERVGVGDAQVALRFSKPSRT
jgi:hypothetical protein